MSSTTLQLITDGLVATLSPLGFAATLAVIRSGRLKAAGFGFGFVSGQLLTCAILVAVGVAFIPDRGAGKPTLRGVLAVCLGVAVLWIAVMLRRRPESAAPRPSGRSQKVLDRLGRLRLGTALAAGLLLGIGGPKRLVLTALAAATIAASTAHGSTSAALVISYTAIATFLAWAPIVAFEVSGDRAVAGLDRAQAWLFRHQRSATFYALVAVGVLALAEGILVLV